MSWGIHDRRVYHNAQKERTFRTCTESCDDLFLLRTLRIFPLACSAIRRYSPPCSSLSALPHTMLTREREARSSSIHSYYRTVRFIHKPRLPTHVIAMYPPLFDLRPTTLWKCKLCHSANVSTWFFQKMEFSVMIFAICCRFKIQHHFLEGKFWLEIDENIQYWNFIGYWFLDRSRSENFLYLFEQKIMLLLKLKFSSSFTEWF